VNLIATVRHRNSVAFAEMRWLLDQKFAIECRLVSRIAEKPLKKQRVVSCSSHDVPLKLAQKIESLWYSVRAFSVCHRAAEGIPRMPEASIGVAGIASFIRVLT